MKKILIVINIFLLISILILSYKLNVDINLDHILEDFSKNHIFGTDNLGRDVFALVVVGGFRTILVVFVATSISFFIGTFLGITAGYFENIFSTIIKTSVDLMLIIPTFICAVIISSIFGINPLTAGLSLGIFGIGNYMNHSMALTKREKEKEYILASKILGVPTYSILYKGILKNILPELLVNLGNTASGIILLYSSLTFIGLGADFTKPDWGTMLFQYRIYIISKPSLIIIPTLCIIWITLSLHFIFDSKQDL